MNTQLDLRGPIPFTVRLTDGKTHEVKWMDSLVWEPGSIYLFDRGYLDFARLYRLEQAGAFFVIRAKDHLQYCRLYAHPVEPNGPVCCDQVISLTGFYAKKSYPAKLRRIRFYDQENQNYLVFLTNQFGFEATTIAALYRNRWKVELFFKWIKQHLRIKTFFGTSPNAVHTQIWIAIATYVLVAIMKKEHQLDKSLHQILQKVSINLFEKIPLHEVVMKDYDPQSNLHSSNQLSLFDL